MMRIFWVLIGLLFLVGFVVLGANQCSNAKKSSSGSAKLPTIDPIPMEELSSGTKPADAVQPLLSEASKTAASSTPLASQASKSQDSPASDDLSALIQSMTKDATDDQGDLPAPVAQLPSESPASEPGKTEAAEKTTLKEDAAKAEAAQAAPSGAGHNANAHETMQRVLAERDAARLAATQNPGVVLEELIAPTRAVARIGDYDVMGESIEQMENGSLKVNKSFVVRGDGTAEKPYIVSWELLVASQKQFDPRQRRYRIPESIAMLHGKHVTLQGYVAFPLMMQQPMELLAMLNQWDGCCIGVPPTAYDAVEVKLKRKVSGDARFSITGEVTGVFKVEPYISGQWLVGLFVLEKADFTPGEIGPGAGS